MNIFSTVFDTFVIISKSYHNITAFEFYNHQFLILPYLATVKRPEVYTEVHTVEPSDMFQSTCRKIKQENSSEE